MRSIQNVAKPGYRNLRLLKVLPQLRQTQDRLCHLVSDHIEGYQRANCHCIVENGLRSKQ